MMTRLFSFFLLLYKLALQPQETLQSSCRQSSCRPNKHNLKREGSYTKIHILFFVFFFHFVWKFPFLAFFFGGDKTSGGEHFTQALFLNVLSVSLRKFIVKMLKCRRPGHKLLLLCIFFKKVKLPLQMHANKKTT